METQIMLIVMKHCKAELIVVRELTINGKVQNSTYILIAIKCVAVTLTYLLGKKAKGFAQRTT